MRNMKKSETTEQMELFTWARRHDHFIPELKLLYHVPNEGKRTNGNILKAAGLKKGVPDIHLPVPRREYCGLYIELKYGKNKPTKEQQEFISLLRQQGNKVSVAYSMTQAREIIRHYLARTKFFDLVNCEEAVKIFDRCEGIAVEGTPCHKCRFYSRNPLGNHSDNHLSNQTGTSKS